MSRQPSQQQHSQNSQQQHLLRREQHHLQRGRCVCVCLLLAYTHACKRVRVPAFAPFFSQHTLMFAPPYLTLNRSSNRHKKGRKGCKESRKSHKPHLHLL